VFNFTVQEIWIILDRIETLQKENQSLKNYISSLNSMNPIHVEILLKQIELNRKERKSHGDVENKQNTENGKELHDK
jgi:hypothetical protein